MSNLINTELYERASEMITYWDVHMYSKLIEQALESGDLDLLEFNVKRAEGAAAIEEMGGADVA